MKIIIDENIAFAEEAFSTLGNVELIYGREINTSNLKNADVLVVRSITKINKSLLEGTNIKFVGTATIGTDHIDKDYLKSKNIFFADAAGCNSHAVKEYFFTALLNILNEKKLSFKDLTLGVVGVGNIGRKIVPLAETLGIKVLQNDPPLERESVKNNFVDLKKILTADIITLHVPLNLEGQDKTFHLFDENVLSQLKNETILINASRGPVIDNEALNSLIEKKNLTVALDVWENEPGINIDLLKKVKFASPHIAGYTLEGKVNGTIIIYDSLCKFLDVKPAWKPILPPVINSEIKLERDLSIEENLKYIFNKIYSIENDDKEMRKNISLPNEERGKYFDQLRKNYKLRREFNNYTIEIEKEQPELINILKKFRFNFSV